LEFIICKRGKFDMKFLKYILVALLAMALVACGGGGGSPGTVSGAAAGTSTGTGSSTTGSSTTTATMSVPTITLTIVDATGAAVTSNSIGSGALFYAKALVKNAGGNTVANKLVTFATASTVANLVQASALTDANGVAKVQISPVSVTSANAGNLVASATVDTVSISSDLDYQTSAANVSLTNMQVAPSSISALQSSAVTVEGRVNGTLAGSSVVAVNFSASCGSFSPASASTSSAGIASTTYQSAVNCSGPVTLTAQATGATAVTTTVNVATAQAANIVFTSATVPLMVSSAASGGLKQSTLKFQVLDGAGAGMSGQSVSISLASPTISAGVTFSVGGTATTGIQTVTTDSSGYASVTVSSGGLPTPVVVTAALVSNPTVQASSSGVAVTSGRATQNAASLSATKLSIEGFNVDGVQSTLTMRVADRQANPIPAGAVVNFVASHGLVQGTCTIDSASQCSVTYTSQGIRPTNGRAVILAYMDGEESFVDQNGDNIWQSTEPFYDVGALYRDDNENGSYDAATEQTYPGGMTGTGSCAGAVYAYPSVVNSCDSTWSSSIRVRQQATISLATSEAVVVLTTARSVTGFTVRVTDLNGNAMPTGTTVSAAVITTGATCTISSVSPNVVRNSANGGAHDIKLSGDSDCSTVKVDVTVTSPSSVATVVRF
jgi:protocatechuate 3,4-dioxygenase beta subunit